MSQPVFYLQYFEYQSVDRFHAVGTSGTVLQVDILCPLNNAQHHSASCFTAFCTLCMCVAHKHTHFSVCESLLCANVARLDSNLLLESSFFVLLTRNL